MSKPPMKYRKKPVVVEAIRFKKPYWMVQEFCPGLVFLKGGSNGTKVRDAFIPTGEGGMHVELGDWIIKGAQGEFYLCDPDVFAATYEVVPSE